MSKCNSCGYLNKESATDCFLCDFKLKDPEPEKVYVIPKKSKKQKKITEADLKLYWEIWEEREHFCEVSRNYLGEEFNIVFFSHILTKASYPRFRHYKKNILLMSFKTHQEWEFGDRKDQKWNPVRDLEEELIIEYYNQPTV